MSKLKTQFGDSVTADGSKNTWTFEMKGQFNVTAGAFAILPEEKYQKLLTALKGIRNSMNVHPDCEPNSEFEDMVSRCDEVIKEQHYEIAIAAFNEVKEKIQSLKQ